MQNLAKLFYPPHPSDDSFFPSKAQLAYHFNSPISQTSQASGNGKEQDFESMAEAQRSNSIQLEIYQNNLFDTAVRAEDGSLIVTHVRTSNLSCMDRDQMLFDRAQSPSELLRGRSLTTQSQISSSQRKKGVLVIKKESINRQNSQSKSPTNQDHQIKMTSREHQEQKYLFQGSPKDFSSPKTREFSRFTIGDSSASQDLCRESLEGATSMKNSVIIRKTVGELKRAQLNGFYFENQLIKSQGSHGNCIPRQSMPLAPTNSGIREKNSDYDFDKIKGFELAVNIGRNSLGSNYQHFIQRTDIGKQSPGQPAPSTQQLQTLQQSQKSKSMHQNIITKPGQPTNLQTRGPLNMSGQGEQVKVQRLGQPRQFQELSPSKKQNEGEVVSLAQKYAQNRNMREQIREKLNQSSGSEDFERQSSNTVSVDNLNSRSNLNKNEAKKIVIQKNKVNFLNTDNDSSQLTRSQGQIVKVSIGKTRESLISLNNMRRTSADKLDQLMPFGPQSQSPECLRRQKSDNLFSMHSHKQSALNHERSQNHLSLYTSNKLEVPKVLKAVPGTFCQDILSQSSPNTEPSTKKKESAPKSPSKLFNQQQQSTTKEAQQLARSRQNNNIFQVRRSQTVTEDKVESDQKQTKVVLTMSQKRESILSNEKYPRKREPGRVGGALVAANIEKHINQRGNANNDMSRVSQSLLLDNFYSRSKEKLVNDKITVEDLSRKQLLESSSTKSYEINRNSTISSQDKKELSIPSHVQGSTSSTTAKSILEGQAQVNRRNTLSYSINRLIDENRCNSPVRISQYLVDIDYIKAQAQERISNASSKPTLDIGDVGHGIEVYGHGRPNSISQSNSNNAILSLSNVNTTEKFKEIIDFLFVPTASAFKKKGKEREFRRPTQNPIRRSKSQQRGNKLGAAAAAKGKDSEYYQKGENDKMQ